jgi:hypothetical protein
MMFLIKLLFLSVLKYRAKGAMSTVEDLFFAGHLHGMIFDSSFYFI